MEIVFWLLFFVGCGVAVGLGIGKELYENANRGLTRRETKVRDDLAALARTQQLNATFLAARRELWEAARYRRKA